MDYSIYLDDAPNMEEEIDLSNKATFLPFLKKSYNFWNKTLFGGKLPRDGEHLTIQTTQRDGVGGFLSHKFREGMTVEELQEYDQRNELYKALDNTLCIQMDIYGTRSKEFHETLIHEMCHLAVWTIDNLFEVGNSSRDGYIRWQYWLEEHGLYNTKAVPGHGKPWKKWMTHCGLDPVSNVRESKSSLDLAVDYNRTIQQKKSIIRDFIPTMKEIGTSNQVSVFPVRFWMDPIAGLERIGVNERKLECVGLLSVLQLWNPSGKFSSLTNRRYCLMYLAFNYVKNMGGRAQGGVVDLESIRNLDMHEERGIDSEQRKLLTQHAQEWITGLQKVLRNRLNPKEPPLSTEELKDLLFVNIVE